MTVDPRRDETARRLFDLLSGKYRAQALSTAASLGLADALAGGPKRADQLAAELGCDADRLGRLLRVLAGIGALDEDPVNGFGLTDLGALLRRDALGPLAAFVGSPEQWNPWSSLRDALGSDARCAFERAHGSDLYTHVARDPAAARRYDAAVDSFTRDDVRALVERFDFGGAHHVVDLGGGRGLLLATLCERWPHLRGVLFDLPHVVASVKEALAARFGERLAFVGGRFQDGVPAGGDAYVLRHVLHNWDDEIACALLADVARAMDRRGHVLVIEGILSPDNRLDTVRLLDLEMLVLTGGRERRKPEWRHLFRRAGLALRNVVALTEASWLLEATPINNTPINATPRRG